MKKSRKNRDNKTTRGKKKLSINLGGPISE